MTVVIKYQTTKISAEQTAGEIAELIRKAGGSRFENRWNDDGELIAVRFGLKTKWGEMPCVLKARTTSIYRLLFEEVVTDNVKRRRTADPTFLPSLRQQAHRIAWRHLKHLVEAWLAAIKLDLAKPHELLLGFVETPEGDSYAERFANEQKLLETEEAV